MCPCISSSCLSVLHLVFVCFSRVYDSVVCLYLLFCVRVCICILVRIRHLSEYCCLCIVCAYFSLCFCASIVFVFVFVCRLCSSMPVVAFVLARLEDIVTVQDNTAKVDTAIIKWAYKMKY